MRELYPSKRVEFPLVTLSRLPRYLAAWANRAEHEGKARTVQLTPAIATCLSCLLVAGCGSLPESPTIDRLAAVSSRFDVYFMLLSGESVLLQGEEREDQYGVQPLTVGMDTRDAILAPKNSKICTQIEPLRSAVLHFGYGLREQDWIEEPTIEFSVEISKEEQTATVFEDSFDASDTALFRHLDDARVSLREYVDQVVSSCFANRASEASPSHVVCANPRVVYPRQPGERNLILISIDTLRADHVNASGYRDRVTTPHVDRFAAQGALFERAFSNAPWTAPSHMSVFTSL